MSCENRGNTIPCRPTAHMNEVKEKQEWFKQDPDYEAKCKNKNLEMEPIEIVPK